MITLNKAALIMLTSPHECPDENQLQGRTSATGRTLCSQLREIDIQAADTSRVELALH
jgi:hypothetical protein